MQALQVQKKKLSLRDVAKPDPDQEVLVQVMLSGICNTDLEIARGYGGFNGTIGHEFVGIVADAEDKSLIGQRVAGEINAGCGQCTLCKAGDPRHCPDRTVLGILGRDGAHADFLRLPATNLVPVPDKIVDEHAVFAEPLAAACGIMERVSIGPNSRVVVIGDGKLGLLCSQAIALTGAAVVQAGKHADKLRIAERRGIETTSPKLLMKHKREFDVVIEASGSPSGISGALELLRPRGTLVLKSTFEGPANMGEINQARLVVDEISILGSRCGRLQPALDLLEQEALDIDSMISEEYPLARGVYAMGRAAKKGVLKVLLRP